METIYLFENLMACTGEHTAQLIDRVVSEGFTLHRESFTCSRAPVSEDTDVLAIDCWLDKRVDFIIDSLLGRFLRENTIKHVEIVGRWA